MNGGSSSLLSPALGGLFAAVKIVTTEQHQLFARTVSEATNRHGKLACFQVSFPCAGHCSIGPGPAGVTAVWGAIRRETAASGAVRLDKCGIFAVHQYPSVTSSPRRVSTPVTARSPRTRCQCGHPPLPRQKLLTATGINPRPKRAHRDGY